MSWKEGYKQALTDYVLKHGTWVDPEPSYYGWIDHNYRELSEHLGQCGVQSTSEPIEDEWQEFVDTFFEGDTTHYGITLKVTCNCGFIEDHAKRVTGSLGEVMLGLLRD